VWNVCALAMTIGLSLFPHGAVVCRRFSYIVFLHISLTFILRAIYDQIVSARASAFALDAVDVGHRCCLAPLLSLMDFFR